MATFWCSRMLSVNGFLGVWTHVRRSLSVECQNQTGSLTKKKMKEVDELYLWVPQALSCHHCSFLSAHPCPGHRATSGSSCSACPTSSPKLKPVLRKESAIGSSDLSENLNRSLSFLETLPPVSYLWFQDAGACGQFKGLAASAEEDTRVKGSQQGDKIRPPMGLADATLLY